MFFLVGIGLLVLLLSIFVLKEGIRYRREIAEAKKQGHQDNGGFLSFQSTTFIISSILGIMIAMGLIIKGLVN